MKHNHNKDEHVHHDHKGHVDHQNHNSNRHVGHAYHEEQVEEGVHEHHNHGNYKELFLKSLPLGIIVLLLSPMFGLELPFQFTFPYSNISRDRFSRCNLDAI